MSIIYHFIRGQEVIKLYVLFSVLEICDKLLYSFGADMLEGARPSTPASQSGTPASGAATQPAVVEQPINHNRSGTAGTIH